MRVEASPLNYAYIICFQVEIKQMGIQWTLERFMYKKNVNMYVGLASGSFSIYHWLKDKIFAWAFYKT